MRLELTEEQEHRVLRLREVRNHIKEAQDIESRLKAEILADLGEAEEGTVKGERVVYIQITERETFDVAALKRSPTYKHLFEVFAKSSVVASVKLG